MAITVVTSVWMGRSEGTMAEAGLGNAVLFIDNDVQQRVLTTKGAMDAIEDAYREWDAGQATIGPKTNLYIYNDDDTRYGFSIIHGGAKKIGIVAMRVKSDFHHNAFDRMQVGEGQSLPTSASKGAGGEGKFCGLVYLFSSRNGAPLAILNDGYLQHARVAACAGVAAKYLARENAQTLGLLGSQWMARLHAPAMCQARPTISRIKVYSPQREHREAFAEEMSQKLDVEVQAVDTPEEAVRGTDIVSCCTNSFRRPVLRGAWLEPGMFISNVLASELDDEALARINYTVKNQPFRDLAAHTFEAGSPPADIGRPSEGRGWLRQATDSTPLLSQVIAGKAPGRTAPEQITFFSNNEGTGIQFAAVGGEILARLKEQGDPGLNSVPLDWFLQDIPN
jgi:ornithine cyclodeaminase/alanine dehydrogenase-like protein (mu-crystallin family)